MRNIYEDRTIRATAQKIKKTFHFDSPGAIDTAVNATLQAGIDLVLVAFKREFNHTNSIAKVKLIDKVFKEVEKRLLENETYKLCQLCAECCAVFDGEIVSQDSCPSCARPITDPLRRFHVRNCSCEKCKEYE